MSDELSRTIDDAYPSCPRCGGRLEDGDSGFDTDLAWLHCPLCGLDVIAGG